MPRRRDRVEAKKAFCTSDNSLNFRVFIIRTENVFSSIYQFFLHSVLASTPPTVLPASTIENLKDWSDLRNEMNGNNTIINGQTHLNSNHVSDKSMLISSRFKIETLRVELKTFPFPFLCRWQALIKLEWHRSIRTEIVVREEVKLADGRQFQLRW